MKIVHENSDIDTHAHVITLQKDFTKFHWHEKYEFCQLIDKDCNFLIDSEEIHAKKGDIIAINEYDFHIFKPIYDDSSFRIIQFPPSLIMDSVKSDTQIKTHITKEELESIPGLAEKFDCLYLWMEEECKSVAPDKYEFAKLYAHLIYKLLSRHFSIPRIKSETPRKDFYRIIEYVNEHFTEDINITDISKELYIARSRVSSLFLKYSSVALTEYIDTLRIEHVNKLLKEDKDVTNAAYESGFSSIRTFNSVYKRIMKITPTQYIKEEK